jgi:hypothetical protein
VFDVAIPEEFQGFIRLCRNITGRSMRVDNIAHLVVIVEPNAQQQAATDLTPPPGTFTAGVIRYFAPTVCGTEACRVPPGASLQLEAGEPVRILLDFDFDETVSATFTRVAVEELAGRLTGRPNAAQRLADCAEGVQSTLQGSNWEEAFLNAAGTAPGCRSLYDDIFGADEAAKQTYTRRMLSRARQLSGGAWADVALLGAKTVLALR